MKPRGLENLVLDFLFNTKEILVIDVVYPVHHDVWNTRT
jgi:hypothetical protein